MPPRSGQRGTADLPPVIAIDGPAGAGKSTVARAVAQLLNLAYLDSGALYRAIAWAARRAGVADAMDPLVDEILKTLPLEADPGDPFRVYVDGVDVTAEIRDPDVGGLASALATRPAVRARVGEILRRLASRRACVVEGRDIGSSVFPGATLKIHLSASLAARAQRRQIQLRERGIEVGPEAVRSEIEARDARDRGRSASPLRVASDAVLIDNTDLSVAQQVKLIARLFRSGGLRCTSRFYRCVRALVGAGLRLGFDIRLHGTEHVPRGGFLLACNHSSYFDPPMLACKLPRELAFLAKAELFRFPPFAWVLRKLNAIPIRRGAADRQALTAALDALRDGLAVVIFPEGTRIRGGELATPFRGVALLARRGQVPVLPVCVLGTGGQHRPGRRGSVWVLVGEPIGAPEPGSGLDAKYAEQIMQRIRGLAPPAETSR